MSTNRREFLKTFAVAGSAVGLGLTPNLAHALAGSPTPDAEREPTQRAQKPLRILILGGTGFIGPHQVRYAVARGHKITVFNRGRRQADLPKEVEHLVGDRNGQLDALKGKTWDVVIDNPTTLPKWVRDSGAILKGNTGQYIFISTISTYAPMPRPGMDETAELAKYTGPDAFAESQVTGQLYGPLKVISEQEAERIFPGKTTVIRPGLIVGPGDETDRFTYWPVRIDRGGEVLAPGDGTGPTQIIDVRDLTEWTIRMAESGTMGIYNATGPARPLTMSESLNGIRAAVAPTKDVKFTWVPADFLQQQQVRPWAHMPTWFSDRGPESNLLQVSVERAVSKGLTYRPFATTAKDTLDWFKTLPAERQQTMRAGLPPDREKAVLDAWKAKG